MPEIVYREAIRRALIEEMERDPSVFVIGEEVAEYEGTFRVTEGLLKRFGELRVVDTPISEEAFTGMAVGAAMSGLRPVVEYMTINFSLPAFDQIINHAAKMYYMSGGQFSVPLVLRGPQGPGVQLSAQHSQSLETFFAHVPGLKVVAQSVTRTDRAVGATEDARTGSFAAEVMARIYEELFDELDAPVERVTGEDVPIPYSRPLEQLAVPNEQSVVAAVKRTLWREG